MFSGKTYSMMVIKVILATLLRSYKVTATTKERNFCLAAQTTLKRKGGFKIAIELREWMYVYIIIYLNKITKQLFTVLSLCLFFASVEYFLKGSGKFTGDSSLREMSRESCSRPRYSKEIFYLLKRCSCYVVIVVIIGSWFDLIYMFTVSWTTFVWL